MEGDDDDRVITYDLAFDDFLDAPHLAVRQSDFDAMRMGRRFGEEFFDDALGQFAGGLILLQDDQDGHAGFDVCAYLPIYGVHGD